MLSLTGRNAKTSTVEGKYQRIEVQGGKGIAVAGLVFFFSDYFLIR